MASTDSHEEQPSSSVEHFDEDKSRPVFAKAKFSFEGRNNDELSFKKGDIIAITQQMDGGWWEGTFASNTGWFPSGYVTIIDDSERIFHVGGKITVPNGQSGESLQHLGTDSSRQAYRQQILEGFLESERSYVNILAGFYNGVLLKFGTEKKIPEDQFSILCGNLQNLVVYQQEIFNDIENAVTKDPSNAKVGGILLRAAPTLRHLLQTYCENHPRAIDLVLKNKDTYADLIKSFGSDIKEFISSLSQPFRHLEKYATTLNELERSMHGTHADRGNTQRATVVYREISNLCTSLRKQKEMQLELKNSGLIEGLPLPELEALGDIVYMGTVTLGDEETLVEERLPVDRCLVLFPTTLLVLEATQNLNAYLLKQKVSVDGLIVKRIDPKPTLSVISADGSFDTLMTVSFSEELQRWIESFAACPNVEIDESCCTASATGFAQKHEVSAIRNVAEFSPLRKAEVSQMPVAMKAEKAKELLGFQFDHDLEMVLPETSQSKVGFVKEQPKAETKSKTYSGYCLRPYPVVRGNWAVDYSKKVNVKLRKSASQLDQEDAYLLRIVEGYCEMGRKSRALKSTLNSYQGCQPPQLIVAEDEKIFMEETVGGETVMQEKSLVDTVYSLKDQIINIRKEIRQLAAALEKEQKIRRRLEEFVRQSNV